MHGSISTQQRYTDWSHCQVVVGINSFNILFVEGMQAMEATLPVSEGFTSMYGVMSLQFRMPRSSWGLRC